MNIELELQKTQDPQKLKQLLLFYAKQQSMHASSLRRIGAGVVAEAVEDETESTLARYKTATAALPLSQFRKFRKNWDPSTWEHLFRNQADCDRNHFRCYVPLSADAPRVVPSNLLRSVDDCLRAGDLGHVEDLLTNQALDKHGRKTTVMKLLAKAPEPAASVMSAYQRWLSGSTRSREGLSVCFSRHPYDIAAMSTDRAWQSCFELTQGDSVEYMSYDVKDGAVVAYIIDSNDRNITNPLGRMTLRPYLAVDRENLQLDQAPGRANLILFPSGIVYGQSVPGFQEACARWCKANFRMRGAYYVRRYLNDDVVKDAGETQRPGYKEPESDSMSFEFSFLDGDEDESEYDVHRRTRRTLSGDNPSLIDDKSIRAGHGYNTPAAFNGPVFGYIKFWAGAVESGRVSATNRNVRRALCAATFVPQMHSIADFLASAGVKAHNDDFLDPYIDTLWHAYSPRTRDTIKLPRRLLEYFPPAQFAKCLQETRGVEVHLLRMLEALPLEVAKDVLRRTPPDTRSRYAGAVYR